MTPEPRWLRVEGRCRCQECGAMVDVAWRLFEGTDWTRCYCEPCVETMLTGDD